MSEKFTLATSPGSKKNTSLDVANLSKDAVNVPIAIMKRVNALKNVQFKLLEAESKFYEDLHLLECKYSSIYEPLYEKRKQIIVGEYEPNEEESKWALDDEDDEEEQAEDKKAIEAGADGKKDDENGTTDLTNALKTKINLNDIGSGATDLKGVPDFWLQTFKCVELIAEMIQEYDEPVLKHLQDVKVKMHDQKPYGYTLEFIFKENEYFTNKVLTKTYELKTEVDPKDPFSYEGPDLYKCIGCTIDWKKGKNVTVRLIKKKQKHKGHGTIRVITKELKQDSFFNYFDTPVAEGTADDAKSPISSSTEDGKKSKADSSKDNNEDEMSEKDEALFAADFEIGHFFKERIIPKAVLYFTGELTDEDCYDDYDEEDGEDDEDLDGEDDEDNDDDDDDDNDDEEDEPKHKGNAKKNIKAIAGGKGNKAHPGGADPPECKQQ